MLARDQVESDSAATPASSRSRSAVLNDTRASLPSGQRRAPAKNAGRRQTESRIASTPELEMADDDQDDADHEQHERDREDEDGRRQAEVARLRDVQVDGLLANLGGRPPAGRAVAGALRQLLAAVSAGRHAASVSVRSNPVTR